MADREQYEARINGSTITVDGLPHQLRLVKWTALEPREKFELSIAEFSVLDQVNNILYHLVLIASGRGLTARVVNSEPANAPQRSTP